MMAEGADIDTIARELGIHKATIHQRLRLSALVPELREALDAGKIAPGVAEKAARLDASRQQELVAVLQERGTVTGKDVDGVRRVRQQEAVALLPDDVFAAPDLEEVGIGPAAPGSEATRIEIPATGDPWYAFRVTIARVMDLIPDDADVERVERIRSLLTSALAEAEEAAEESMVEG
jgi:hypothetical protein